MELTDVLDDMVEDAEGDQVSLEDLFKSLDTRGYGPLLLFPALVAISPLGTLPGMSLVTGTFILVVAIQLVFKRSHPWMPQRLLEISVSRKKLEKTRDRLDPWLQWAQRPLKQRLSYLVEPPAEQIIAFLCVLLSLTFYPLSLVPFGVILPGIAVLLLAISLTAKDGAVAILGFLASVSVLWSMFSIGL